MKRILAITTVLLIALGLHSCGKSNDNQWSRFFGFTKADIVGHYDPNPDESCYTESPTQGVTVYRDVTIDITDLGENQNLVRFHIVIPSVLNKTFTCNLSLYEGESVLTFSNESQHEDVILTVYKNNSNQVRLQGRERRSTSSLNGADYSLHYFDVVKTN